MTLPHPCRAALLAAIAAAAPGAQAITLFDDFSGTGLSPYRWAVEQSAADGALLEEGRRIVSGGQLRLESKSWSDNTVGYGFGQTQHGVRFQRSEDINDIRATVTMRSVAVNGCSGVNPGMMYARIYGGFFNVGNPIPGSRFNDVTAAISVYRASDSPEASNVFDVFVDIERCLDDACHDKTRLGGVTLGTTTLNTPTQIEIAWDSVLHRFSMQQDGMGVFYAPYTVSDVHRASNPAKMIEIASTVPHCSYGRISVYGAADVDDVKTNPLP
jgi:hypothetical protein